MRTLTLEIQNDTLADRVIWMLNHFSSDGLIIKELEEEDTKIDTYHSISQAVNELNLVKSGKIKAKPVQDLLNAL
ncbi:MAG: hypothetical protein Q7S59_03265 [Sulfurimonas sp.]|nr:hypothetical protein [Sulfurimonas sp.]